MKLALLSQGNKKVSIDHLQSDLSEDVKILL